MLKAHVRSEMMVLDVGCGDGTIMKSLGGSCVGIDISLDALGRARVNSEAHVVLGSALALPFKEETFDVIVCTEVLEHLRDVGPAIEQIASILKLEGVVHLTVPLASWYRLLLIKLLGVRPYFLSEEHEREFSAISIEKFSPISSLITAIEDCGLTIDEVKGSYFFPDKVEGPLDRIVNGSTRMRNLAWRLDDFLSRIPKLNLFGRYLALSCRKAQTKSS